MRRSSLLLTLAAALLVAGVGASSASAGSFIPLNTTLDQLLPAGNFTTNAGFTFSAFTYSTMPTGILPPNMVNVNAFNTGFGENGIQFAGSFNAGVGTTNDYAISYVVTAAPGQFITDAYLSIAGSAVGTGSFSTVGETLVNATTGALITTLTASLTPVSSNPVDSVSFAGVTSILVEKDINVSAGTAAGSFASLSIIDQGFSVVPEPTSMALLGIGMAGFFTYRRLFKRAAVA